MLDITRRLLAAAEGGAPVLLASLLEPGPTSLTPGARLLVEADGTRLGSLGDPALDDLIATRAPEAFAEHLTATLYVSPHGLSDRTVAGAPSIYVEVVEAKPVFLVVGAGHVGKAICKLADFLDFHVAVVDDREDFANSEHIPEADEVICDDFEEA
ncbi:MAG: XdhC family protein, partial [Tepidiformaceae bacterium]